jgi:hypothetical protein
MHDEALTRLVRALEEVWDSGGRRFVTVEDTADEGVFLQYLDGQLNLAWPFDEAPTEILAEAGVSVPEGTFVLSWQPRGTAILAVGDLRVEAVADLVEDLLDDVLEADEVAIRVESDR